MKAIANRDTVLKLHGLYQGKQTYHYQSVDLPIDLRLDLSEGDAVVYLGEFENEDEPDDRNGHIWVSYQGRWYYAFADHFTFESQVVVTQPHQQPSWNEVDWNNFNAPVSKYFTVGEVTNMSCERIPTATDVKQNIIKIARCMDDIREWWGGPLGVNSWYRPWHVNTRIGSRAPNHPGGYAVDFRPINGSVWDLQERFKREWYDTGKWQGGFGLGANKGFIHIDLRNRRMWPY